MCAKPELLSFRRNVVVKLGFFALCLLVVRYDRCTCRVLRTDFVDAQGLLPEQSECVNAASSLASTPSRFFLLYYYD